MYYLAHDLWRGNIMRKFHISFKLQIQKYTLKIKFIRYIKKS